MCLSSTWFAGFFQLLRRELLANSILHADETTLMVLKEPGRKARQKSYVWVYRTSGDSPRPVVLYDYQPTRAGECASNFLSGFSGMLHTDGYEAYHCKLPPEVTWRDWGSICTGSLQTHSKACQKKCGTDLWGRRDWGSATNDSRLRRTTKNGDFFRPEVPGPVGALQAGGRGLLRLDEKRIREESRAKEHVWRGADLCCPAGKLVDERFSGWAAGAVQQPGGAFCPAICLGTEEVETAKANGLKPFEYLSFLLETLPTGCFPQDCLPWMPLVQNLC